MPLLKILNVSEWTRMSVVQNSNQFACKLAAQECARMYILGRASALFSAVSLYLHHLFSKTTASLFCDSELVLAAVIALRLK